MSKAMLHLLQIVLTITTSSRALAIDHNKTTPLLTIEGGSFTPLYGSAKTPVKINDFEIDALPVTNSQFLAFTQHHQEWQRSKVKPIFADNTYLKHWKSDQSLGPKAPSQSPVVYVPWFAASKYCEAKGMRLPTVNEWEYVASRPIPGVEVKQVILDWYAIPTPEILPAVTTGLKNSSGATSMHGLIWEWTSDFNSAMVTGESRADGSLDKSFFCGSGSVGAADSTDYAAFLRFGMRSSLKAQYTIGNLGFRCARDKQTNDKQK